MSTPSSVPDANAPKGAKQKRKGGLFRWQGIIPLTIIVLLVVLGWKYFGARAIKAGIEAAGPPVAGSQVDVADLSIRFIPPAIDIRGFAVADNDDLMRNRLSVGRAVIKVELLPLFEKKVVVSNVTVADVQTGARRVTPAKYVPIDTGGTLVSEAAALVKKVNVPKMVLAPIDSLKSVVLNPQDLKAVRAAVALGVEADSAKTRIDRGYSQLNLQPTFDSSTALIARLKDVNVRTLGIDGARRAVSDLRRTVAQVDSAKNRVERLVTDTRRSTDSLQSLVRGIDEARRDDYAMARGLLKLPSFDAPDIGIAIFGSAMLERFHTMVRYAELARKYAPPGLMPKEQPGPKRMRMAGSTVHFVKPTEYPRFLLRRMELSLVGNDGFDYAAAASDVTSDPAIIGRPTLFVARRVKRDGTKDSLRVSGSMDHTKEQSRDQVSLIMTGVSMPKFEMPMLPYSIDARSAAASARFVLEGDKVSGSWTIQSGNIAWVADSTRARTLNTMESLVARAITGINTLEITADIGGTLQAPTFGVRSNLDRVVADRVRAVAGEQIAAAQARLRSQVDRLVEEKSAPVKAKVADLKADADKKLADARARLDEEKKKLEDRVKQLTAGINLPRIP